MKKRLMATAFLVALASTLVLFGCGQPETTIGNAYLSGQQEGVWVTGTGKVSVTPDLATLSLGVSAQELTVAQAQAEAAQAMNSVISVLKSQGIADSDIQTQQFSIQQVTQYDQQTQQQVVVGYRVDNTVTVKIRNLDSVGTVIDAVAQAAGNLTRINGLSFSVEDPTPYYDNARTEAVENAQQTADRLATLSNVTLGAVTYISESAVMPPPISPSLSVPALAPVPETPISPGQTEITLTVQVAYEILK